MRHTDRQMTREQVWLLTAVTAGMAIMTIVLMWRVIG